ncbi:MAG: type 1 glutamine amidotransferase domain-containing protein [Kosmotogaceae bacterium]
MKLKGKRVVVLVENGFEDLEFWVPVMRLREEGAEVIIAGKEKDRQFSGKGCLQAVSDSDFASIDVSGLDGIFIPGGWAPDKLRRYEEVKNLVKSAHEKRKVIGMICHAGLVGISAGIVRGFRSVGSEGIKDDLINAGAVWVDEPALVDGNLVWGRVVKDIPDFCRKLVETLENGLR